MSPPNPPVAKFTSKSDAYVRTDTQIKFLYYPVSLALINCIFLCTSLVGSSRLPKARKAQNRIQITPLGQLKGTDWVL